MSPVLRRYQVMSYVVGTMLLVFCVMIVLRHGFGIGATAEMVVAQIHGILYMIYLVTVAQVAVTLKPSIGRIAAMVVSGFIPFLAFVVEHKTVEDLRALDEATRST
jgi:integral membrane protein